MLRIIAAVIVGYLVIAILIFALFTVAYLVLGADRAFEPATYDVSTTWIVVSIVLGFVAAFIGGVVCSIMAKGTRAPLILAGVVVVLGILVAIPVLTSTDTAAEVIRDGSVGNLEAMQNAKTPAWVALLNPLLGAVGVLAGARFRK